MPRLHKQTARKSRKGKSGFRYNAKTFFFTYPKCDVPKEQAMAQLKQVGVVWAIVCQEKHKDGTNHLHMCGSWIKKPDVRNASHYDFITGKHGNYRAMKKKYECIKYVTKDTDYIVFNFDVEDYLTKHKPKQKIGDKVVKMITEGATKQQIREEYPGYYLIHRNNILTLMSEIEIEEQEKPTTFECPEADESKKGWKEVETWLFQNILKKRKHKQAQLWLFGPPNSGKSYFLNKLRENLRVYNLSLDKWDDEYDDNDYDLIVCDEYTGGKTVSYMNQLAEGTVMNMLRRNRAPYKKKLNLPLIISSNYNIEHVYSKVPLMSIDALKCRFQQIYVDEPGLLWPEDEPEESEKEPSPPEQMELSQMNVSSDTILVSSDEESEHEFLNEIHTLRRAEAMAQPSNNENEIELDQDFVNNLFASEDFTDYVWPDDFDF